jgi:hypothetical protein
MTSRSMVAAWGVVVGLAGVLPSAGTDSVALAARQDSGSLDDAAIDRAVRAGASGYPPLELTDRGGLFSGAGSGYRIILYTPHSWIAHLAAGEFLSAAEIGTEDRAALLRVFASPSAPTIGSSRELSSSVLQVALLDERRRSSLQPQATRPFTTPLRGLLGSGTLTGLEATFRLADVETLRGGAGREFFVRVEGTGYTKDFKIKRKHFNRLPM